MLTFYTNCSSQMPNIKLWSYNSRIYFGC